MKSVSVRLGLLAISHIWVLAAGSQMVFEKVPDAERGFVARGRGGSLGFTDKEVAIAIGKHGDVLRMGFVGARAGSHVEGRDLLPGTSNYFIGPASRWRTDVPQYGGVVYRSLYPGVDLVFHSAGGEMEYDFVLAAGADANEIELRFTGARKLEVNAAGELSIAMGRGTLLQRAPVVYQMRGTERVPVRAQYELSGRDRVKFRVGEYDRATELTIDPVLVFQTYVGGSRTDVPAGIGVDRAGNSYVAGTTNSIDFPRVSQLANPIGGSTLLASFDYGVTYARPDIGAPVFEMTGVAGQPDVVYAATSDGVYRSANDGRTWVARNAGLEGVTVNTVATDPQVAGRVFAGTERGLYRSDDGGVTWQRRSVLGSVLTTSANFSEYITQLVGDGGKPQVLYAVVDYLLYRSKDAGVTWAGVPNPAIEGVNSLAMDPNDARVLYLNGLDGQFSAIWKSTDGGSTWVLSWHLDWVYSNRSMAVDPTNSARVFAVTTSGVYRTLDGGATWSLAGLANATLDELIFEPAHPGVLDVVADEGLQVSQDHGATFHAVAGASPRRDLRTIFFTTSQVPAMLVGGDPDQDAFVVKWNAEGDQILYSTYIGGSYPDFANAMTVDGDGNVYLVGKTQSTDFPVMAGAAQAQQFGVASGFVSKLSPDGNRLVYSTLLGGAGSTELRAVAVDAGGSAYVTGVTESPDYPVTAVAMHGRPAKPCQLNFASTGHSFVTKLSADGMRVSYSTYLGGSCPDTGLGIAVDANGNALVVGSTYSSDFPVTPTALQGGFGTAPGSDSETASGFMVMVNGNGTSALYSSYVGGGFDDIASAVAVDATGLVSVAGTTAGFGQSAGRTPCFQLIVSSFPVSSFTSPLYGNVFAMKVDLTRATPLVSRVFDGCGQLPTSIAVDPRGSTWIAGGSSGSPSILLVAERVGDFSEAEIVPVFGLPSTFPGTQRYGIPLVAPLATAGNGFLIEIAPDGMTVPFGTYLPGNSYTSIDATGGVRIATSDTGDSIKKQQGFGYVSTSLLKLDPALSSPIVIQAPEPFHNLTEDGESLDIDGGEVVVIAGQGVGPATLVSGVPDQSGVMPKTLAGVTVTFGGIAAPLLSVQANQIICVVPLAYTGKAEKNVAVQVRYNDLASNVVRVTSRGSARLAVFGVLNQDGSVNSQANPAGAGSKVSVYVSGVGQTNPAWVDGGINAGTVKLASTVAVLYSARRTSVPLLYAGAAPGQVAGVAQIDFLIPTSSLVGDASPVLTLNGGGAAFQLWVK